MRFALMIALTGVLHALSSLPAMSQSLPKLPTSGCPMAHCDSHLNDAVRMTAPPVGTVVQSDTESGGARLGLGCSSNGTIFACSFASPTGSNLIVYDADGNRIFAAPPALLNHNANKSAPIVFTNGMVLAADNLSVVLFNADGTIHWQTAKPDTSSTISPVLVGTSIILVATQGTGTLSTYDLASGQLLSTSQVSTPDCGAYNTLNTPAVNGNRAYIVGACIADQTHGSLAAIDVMETGGSRGAMTQAWLYSFPGPSGASPLFSNRVIFFDGVASAESAMGTFMAVQDMGTSPLQLWQRAFNSPFGANAGQDPRGGIWVFPLRQSHLYRLSNANGSTLQTITVPVPQGQTPGSYGPSSAVSLSKAVNGNIVLTFGGATAKPNAPAIVVAEDVTAGTPLWISEIGGPAGNTTAAQFPIATDSAGLTRVAFPGYTAGTYFLGKPAN